MASSIAIRFRIEPLRSLAFGGLSGVYAGVGTAINNPAHMMVISNNTDTDIFCSFDGVTDQMFLPAGQARIYDLTSNKALGGGFYLAQGERLYAKDNGVAATSGTVTFEVIYASESV
jgi:hypothetical protein